MISVKKTIPGFLAALSLLFAISASAETAAGRWSGTVASVSGDGLALVGVSERFRLAGGVTELVSGRSLAVREITPGSAVTLRIGPREPDGRIRVDAVVVTPKDGLTLEGPITGIASDGGSFDVLGVRIEVDRLTAFSGRSGSGLVRSPRDLRAGQTAQVALTATAAGALQASHVRISGRSRSSRTVNSRSEDQEFKGTVVAVSDTSWTIDDRTVAVNAQTVFIGAPGLGDFVEVRLHLDGNGAAVADRIQKEDPSDDELEFRGIVEAIGETSWTISGRVVLVNAATVFRGTPQVGDLVEVRTDRASDGTLTATHIKLEDDDDNFDDELEFRGIVESIGATSWTIAGRVVLVNDATSFRGNPQVGDLVEVRADRAPDGTRTATDIKLEDDDNVDDEREFRGIVTSIGDTSWTIGDLVVLVNASTEIRGNPQVGDLVEVRADRAPDGTLTATRIKTEDGSGGDDDGGNSGPGGDDEDGDGGGGGGNSGPG
jgi:hypothetical protein